MVHWLLPRQLRLPSISDQWLTPRDPRNAFTNDSLGMVADLWAPFLENYYTDSPVNHPRLMKIAEQQKEDPNGRSELSRALQKRGWTSPYVTTTLSMTLDIKKRLPSEGVKWLFVRAQAKAIEKGNFDVEVIILDETGHLVALSHQTGVAAEFRPERRDTMRLRAESKL